MGTRRTTPTLTVMVVEDHPLMGQAIKVMIERDARIKVLSVVATADEALVAYPQDDYDLVLTDVQLARKGSGLDLVKRLRAAHPEAKICVYSAFADPQLVQRLLDAGAGGYVRKTASAAEFMECLLAVADGQREVMDRETAGDMVKLLRSPAAFGTYAGPALTRRELQVVAELVTGATTATIGRHLGITPRTVQHHVERAMAKTGATSRVHLVSLAHDLELLPRKDKTPVLPRP